MTTNEIIERVAIQGISSCRQRNRAKLVKLEKYDIFLTLNKVGRCYSFRLGDIIHQISTLRALHTINALSRM